MNVRKKLYLSCVTCLAIFALSGAAASAANAATFQFESNPTYLSGSQVGINTLTLGAFGAPKCNSQTVSSTEITGSTPTLNLSRAMGECTWFGQATTVNANGCTEVLTATSATTGTFSYACPAGKSIVITPKSAGCSVSIPAQGANAEVKFKNVGSGSTRSVAVTYAVREIAYQSTGGVCGGSGSNGTLNGEMLIKAYANPNQKGAQHGFWIS
jgi:hypothetical protein